jgi:hypothetical protein
MAINVMYKSYCDESIIDIEDDLYEAMNSSNIPTDKHGLSSGTYQINVVWQEDGYGDEPPVYSLPEIRNAIQPLQTLVDMTTGNINLHCPDLYAKALKEAQAAIDVLTSKEI